MRPIFWISMLLAVLASREAFAQNAALRGKVVDDQNAVLIGASITIKQGERVLTQTQTTNEGTFEAALPAGTYTLEIDAPDFDKLVKPVQITGNMQPSTYTMKLAQIKAEVTVQANANQVELSPDSNLTATVMDKDLIEQLPDDSDELLAYLTDLAGPRANATGGGDFIIDGFSTGVLPPKEQILQIRINNNPFSSEFQRPGYGRVEIVTKPGTGQYHGSAQFMFRDQALNANTNLLADPSTGLAVPKAPYQRRNYVVNFSGPIIRNRMTAATNLNREDDSPSSALHGIDPITGIPEGGYIIAPSVRENYNSRPQLSIGSGQRHVLNFNLEYQSRSQSNAGVGNLSLVGSPTGATTFNGYPLNNAYSTGSKYGEIQVRETEIISSSMIHDLRLEWNRNVAHTTPNVTIGPTITISGASQFGSANNSSQARTTNFEFQNALSYTGKILTLRTGIQGQRNDLWSSSHVNYNGSYTFADFADLQAGKPSLFTITTGIPTIEVVQWQVGAFLQTDWKATKQLMVSAGTRYQIQTNLFDRNDFDPRVALAYQLTGSTVLRVGFGTFHQVLNPNTVVQLSQNDGLHQLETLIVGPPGFPVNLSTVAGTPGTSSKVYARSFDLRTPYSLNSAVSIEQTLSHGLSINASFDDIKGAHLYRGRDTNAPLSTATCSGIVTFGCVRPNPFLGIVDQLESSGDSRFESLTIGFRQRVGSLNLLGNYSYSENKGDSFGPFGLPSNNYNLRADWGLLGNNTTHRVQTVLNYRFRFGLIANTNIIANTGRPYNQILNTPGPDGQYNQRPTGVPINSLLGPGALNVSLNLNKSFVLREAKSVAPQAGANQGADGPGGPGGFGRGGPGPGGGGDRGGGGLGGGPGGGSGVTMTLFSNMTNVINRSNLSTPGGELNTPFYRISTNKLDPRIVELGVRFNF